MATFVPTEVGVHDVFVAARGSPDGSDESQEGALIEKSYQTRICNAKVNNIMQVWREFNCSIMLAITYPKYMKF